MGSCLWREKNEEKEPFSILSERDKHQIFIAPVERVKNAQQQHYQTRNWQDIYGRFLIDLRTIEETEKVRFEFDPSIYRTRQGENIEYLVYFFTHIVPQKIEKNQNDYEIRISKMHNYSNRLTCSISYK